MSNTITWLPNTESDIASYKLEKATDALGPFSFLVQITHDLGDSNVFDGVHFFYVDAAGTTTDWYRLISVDTSGLESAPSTPFTIPSTLPPPSEIIGINEDYGGTNELQPVDTSANPIESTQIRIFFKVDYDNNNLDNPIGITLSTITGAWGASIFVEPGFTYTIHFEKPGEFGPSTVELTV